MKVILLRDTAKLGKRGEVKDVSDAYAVNVLIKKGDALQATPAELSKWKTKEESKKRQKDVALNTFLSLVEALRTSRVLIRNKKYDDKGQLFAHIRDTDIADAIFETVRLSIDPKQILVPHTLKSIGKHTVQIKQGDKVADVVVEVI
ncbi:MAG: hypothetical protein RLZZ308_734 [Candidatus Parcubacteria bacterium]|jgi:large subunit ribosomal protein L9